MDNQNSLLVAKSYIDVLVESDISRIDGVKENRIWLEQSLKVMQDKYQLLILINRFMMMFVQIIKMYQIEQLWIIYQL